MKLTVRQLCPGRDALRENALHEPPMDPPKTSNVIPCLHRFIRKIIRPLDKLCWGGPLERDNNKVALRIPEKPTEGRSLRVEFRDGGVLEFKASSEVGHRILFIIVLVHRG